MTQKKKVTDKSTPKATIEYIRLGVAFAEAAKKYKDLEYSELITAQQLRTLTNLSIKAGADLFYCDADSADADILRAVPSFRRAVAASIATYPESSASQFAISQMAATRISIEMGEDKKSQSLEDLSRSHRVRTLLRSQDPDLLKSLDNLVAENKGKKDRNDMPLEDLVQELVMTLSDDEVQLLMPEAAEILSQPDEIAGVALAMGAGLIRQNTARMQNLLEYRLKV